MNPLFQLQRDIADGADPDADPAHLERLCVTDVSGQIHVDFFGDPSGDAFQELLAALTVREVAEWLTSIGFRGPDEGANGTRNWDLTSLADADVVFPRLRSLSIEQGKPADHNRTIVARVYDEEGVLARLLVAAPMLESLVTPSAPNADFFDVPYRPLSFLSVDAGYDHQGFIGNLSRASCFPELRSLGFGEYNETYMEDYAQQVTPFTDYQGLFASPAFVPVRRFEWRNPACSAEQISQLKAMDPTRSMLVVRWSATG